jgi:choline-sulfatase
MTMAWERAGLWEAYRRDVGDRFATKPHVVRPSPLGYDHYYDTYVGRQAYEYLSAYDRDEPWFCWVSFGGPHEPWDTPEPYASMYPPETMPAAKPPFGGQEAARGLLSVRTEGRDLDLQATEVAAMRADYAGNVTLIDDQIGGILELLRSRGEYDRTLVVFASDHGEMNGDFGLVYKSNFLSSAVDIPLIVRPPAGSAGNGRGVVSDALVELIDVGATILDYAEVPGQAQSAARSLRAVVEGAASEHRPAVVSEFADHTMVQDRRWKAEFDPAGDPVLLFSLDPAGPECENLVSDQGAQSALSELRARWEDVRAGTRKQHAIVQGGC